MTDPQQVDEIAKAAWNEAGKLLCRLDSIIAEHADHPKRLSASLTAFIRAREVAERVAARREALEEAARALNNAPFAGDFRRWLRDRAAGEGAERSPEGEKAGGLLAEPLKLDCPVCGAADGEECEHRPGSKPASVVRPPTEPGMVAFEIEAVPHDWANDGTLWHKGTGSPSYVAAVFRQYADEVESYAAAGEGER